MRVRGFSLLAILGLMLIATNSFASAIVFNPSAFYYTREDENLNDTDFKQTIFNFKLGYIGDSGLYLGLAYDMESRQYNSNSVSDQDRKSVGGTIGYVTNGWQFLGTYYFQSELEDYDGTGYAIDVGYIFNIGSVAMGPLLSYRHWEYDELNGASVNPKVTHSNILPAIQFQFAF